MSDKVWYRLWRMQDAITRSSFSRQSTSVVGVRQDESAKKCILVMVNGLAVGGGFFYLPGKAVTADHNLPASHRKGSELTIRTVEKSLQMEIGTCSKKYDYALLHCSVDRHSDHLNVRRLRGNLMAELIGAPLTLFVFQTGMQNELVHFRQGTHLKIGLMPAYGRKLSDKRLHLLYDMRSWAGDSGTAVVLFEGEVVGMHVEVADVLMEQLGRDQLSDHQMQDVAESLAAAAANTPQSGVALLCHVFAK